MAPSVGSGPCSQQRVRRKCRRSGNERPTYQASQGSQRGLVNQWDDLRRLRRNEWGSQPRPVGPVGAAAAGAAREDEMAESSWWAKRASWTLLGAGLAEDKSEIHEDAGRRPRCPSLPRSES